MVTQYLRDRKSDGTPQIEATVTCSLRVKHGSSRCERVLKGCVSKQFLGMKIGRTMNLNQATHPDGF